MPPKTETKQKNAKRTKEKSKQKTLDKSVPPFDTRDPKEKPYKNDQKNANSFFQRELEMKQQEQLKDMSETVKIIKNVDKSSTRLKKRQIFDYGMTLDEIESMREEIEAIKIQNDRLYAEMEHSKAEHEKLEKELKETKQRYGHAVDQMKKLKKDSIKWKETKDKLVKTETRVQNLYASNRRLRTVLLQNKVDPNVDARDLERNDSDGGGSGKSVKSNKTFPKPYKRRLTLGGRYDTIEELDKLRKLHHKETKTKYGFLDAVFDQMDPAYFGYYTRKKQYKSEGKERQYQVRPGLLARNLSVPPLIKGHY